MKFIFIVQLFLISVVHAGLVNYPLKNFSWRTNHLQVCFEAPVFPMPNIQGTQVWSYYEYRAEIQTWITHELLKANVEAFGWKDCIENDVESLHIGIQLDEWGSGFTQFLGKRSKGTFSAVNVGYAPDESNEWYPRFTLLHEILHALGFQHEHERPDSNTCQYLQSLAGEYTDSFLSLGDYDPQSVMNYCIFDETPAPSSNEEGLLLDKKFASLTNTDIAALKAYMFEPVAEVVNPPKSRSNKIQHTFRISGLDVQSYSFLFGKENEIDCNNSGNYGGPKLVSEGLTIETSLPGKYKLCLLGHGIQSNQNPNAYTSFTWTKTSNKIMITSRLDAVSRNSNIPVTVESNNSRVFIKVVEASNLSDCRQKRGYTEREAKNLTFVPSQWIKEWADEDGNEKNNFILCTADDLRDASLGDFDYEHFIVLKDGIGFRGISNDLRDGDLVKALPSHLDGTFKNYRFALVSNEADCFKDVSLYSNVRSVDLPAIFTFDPKLKYLCGIAQDKFDNWTQLKDANIQLLNNDTW